MTTCANVELFGGLVNDLIKQYEKTLEDDTLSKAAIEETQAAIDELRAYQDAVKAEDLNFINDYGVVAERNEENAEVFTSIFEQILGNTFTFKEHKDKNDSTGVLRSVGFVDGGIRISFEKDGFPRSHTFALSSEGKSNENAPITIPSFKNVLNNYQAALVSKSELEIALGSSLGDLRLEDQYKQAGYMHGDTNQMRALMTRLHFLGGEKASESELDAHLDLLDTLKPDFFDSLNLYLRERGEKSEGMYRINRIDLDIDPAPRLAGNQQSEASIYMEEVIHSMVASAIHSNTAKARRLKRQLYTMVEAARQQLTWRDFLPETSIDKDAEVEQAKATYDYIFKGNNADQEFIAKALVVPEVTRAMKSVKVREGKDSRRLTEKVNDFFSTLVDILRGTFTVQQKDQNVHEAITNLAYKFGEINSKARRKLEKEEGFVGSLIDAANNIDEATGDLLNSIKDKLVGKEGTLEDMPRALFPRVLWLTKFMKLALVNPVYTKVVGALATAWGVKPDSTFREIIGGLFQTDNVQKIAEVLAMRSGHLDKMRNDQVSIVRAASLSGFTDREVLTKEMEENLTAVLVDTDLSSLFGKYSVAKDAGFRATTYNNKTLRKLLTDDATLERLIKDTKRALKDADDAHYSWHRDQAVGLGRFMATHVATPEQNLNAHNIARGLRSSHRKKPTPRVVKAIDELATLVALKNTDKTQRESVAELMKSEWEGVNNLANMYEGFKINSDETVFKNNKTHKIKGYSREVFDDTIVMEIAPVEDREAMEHQGFTFRGELVPRAGDNRNKAMALYVTDRAGRPDRLRGGVRLNPIRHRGTTITDVYFKEGSEFSSRVIQERAQRDINRIERESLRRAEKMEKGEYDFTDTVHGVTAIIDESGKVVDFRYMMDKATKKRLLKQDTRISEVLARSFGTILDKDKSAAHNEQVLSLLQKDMTENWTEGVKGNDGLTDYTLIGPGVSDPEMRKLYRMLPKEFQSFVQNRDDETLAVRTDLLHLVFGYSQMTVANFPGLDKITPAIVMKVIKFAEMLWMESIKIVKTQILLKVPAVLVGNLLSNLVYSVMRGYNPVKVLALYMESYRDISNYNKQVKEVQALNNSIRELGVARSKDTISAQRRASIDIELKKAYGARSALQRRMVDSPVHELVEMGLDQNVEDITNELSRDANRITNFFDEKLEQLPKAISTGLDILFITKRTRFYKFTNEVLETSDLVSRDVQNRLEKEIEQKQVAGVRRLPSWWLEKQEAGYNPKQKLTGVDRSTFLEEAKKVRHYDLVEDYINYSKPSGRFEDYLNKIGILMFTKYTKRIQRIMLKQSRKGPLKMLITGLITGRLGIPSVYEQSVFVKDWYGDSLGPGNIVPLYGFAGNFTKFMAPPLLLESTYDFY